MATHQLTLQVNGHPGRTGIPGTTGQQGGSAGQPTAGGDAGSIDLYRATDPAVPSRVLARMQCTMPGGTTEVGEAELDRGAAVHLIAVGGSGGDGGRGGNGANGHDGRRGFDASGSTPGTNGGNGTDGGSAGAGTSGAAGGRGGRIIDRVPGVDMDLFAATRHQVSGGPGGAAGRHGRPGQGGRGGAGGSSGSYQELSYVLEGMPMYNTVYVSGGSRGMDGRSGSMPTNRLTAGTRGAAGELTLEVTDGPAQGRYRDRYRLAAGAFAIAPTDGHTFVEFGLDMAAELTLANTQSMPTPHASDLLVCVVPGPRVRPNARVALPRGMPQGRPTHIQGLRFNIPWPAHAATDKAFAVSLDVHCGVQTARGEVVLEEAGACVWQSVGYPLQLTNFACDSVTYEGKPSRARWTLTNVSDRPLGGTTRPAQMVLRFIDGDAQAGTVRCATDDERLWGDLSEPLVATLSPLAPGASATVTGDIHFDKSAEPYSQARLGLAIHLGPPRGGAPSAIQERTAAVQLAQSYVARPESSAILLVNHATGRGEIDAWREVFAALGMQMDIWNASVYGTHTLADVFGDARFATGCQDKTLVVLNNAYTRAGAPSALADGPQPGDLATMARNAGVATYVVGPNANLELVRLLPDPGLPAVPHGSLHKFATAEAAGVAATQNVCSSDGIDVRTNRRAPRAEHLRRKADKLVARLSAAHPERNYAVTTALDVYPHPADSKKRNHLGSITLRRGLDTPQHVATALPTSAQRLHEGQFVRGEDNRFALYKTFPFARKLTLLHTVSGNAEATDMLVRAIVSDLADEQAMLRTRHARGPLGRDAIEQRMERLKATVSDRILTAEAASEPVARRIRAAMEHMLTGRWYHHARPWGRRGVDVDTVTRRLLKALPTDLPGAEASAAIPPPPAALATEFTLRAAG